MLGAPGWAANVVILIVRKFSFIPCRRNFQVTQCADRILETIRIESVGKVRSVLMDHDAPQPEQN